MGKSMGNPWEIHGKSMEIDSFPPGNEVWMQNYGGFSIENCVFLHRDFLVWGFQISLAPISLWGYRCQWSSGVVKEHGAKWEHTKAKAQVPWIWCRSRISRFHLQLFQEHRGFSAIQTSKHLNFWKAQLRDIPSPSALPRLGEIRIPNVQEAFEELMQFDPEERRSSRRERVMANILVDVYMLCHLEAMGFPWIPWLKKLWGYLKMGMYMDLPIYFWATSIYSFEPNRSIPQSPKWAWCERLPTKTTACTSCWGG